jgi:eukaryotic-like serine/threonine-protein kinase
MSVIEPGARLAGRYRLETRVSEAAGSTVWKAIDETLARAVTVRTFAPGFPRVHEVVTAARAASRLTDPRLAQVFDAEDNTEQAYVVSEWISGETLEELLANGPLDPARAATLVLEAAEALTAAHGTGLAHLGLTPRDLLWTTGGTVKITGLGVTAALSMVGSEHPAAADTRGLGRLLYAALTGHWPGPEETSLPPAPLRGDRHCSPRQVRPELPAAIDEVACRALPPATLAPSEAFSDPAQLAAALRTVPRTPPHFVPVTPARSGSAPTRATPAARTSHDLPTAAAAAPPGNQRHTRVTHHERDPHELHLPPDRRVSPGLVGLAVAIVAVVLVVGGWALFGDDSGDGTATPPSSSTSAKPKRSTLNVTTASGFDPGGDDDENSQEAARAIDGKPGTVWTTEGYNSAELGELKRGVGLLLDMGGKVDVTSLKVSIPGEPGARVELRVGDGQTLGALAKVAGPQDHTGGNLELQPAEPAAGRYVLLWFTKLASDGGKFRGQVGDVVVYGTK